MATLALLMQHVVVVGSVRHEDLCLLTDIYLKH